MTTIEELQKLLSNATDNKSVRVTIRTYKICSGVAKNYKIMFDRDRLV